MASRPEHLRPGILLPFVLVAGLAAVLAWLLWPWHPAGDEVGAPAHGRLELAEAPTGGDFELDGAQGSVALSDFRGKVVLLYFGYTWCPDICPTNLAIIAYALKQLTAAERAQVQALFVSVDPARDNPERLAEYVAYFHPGILGATGSEARLATAAARFGAAYRRREQRDSAMGYLVDHSSLTYVIDQQGQLVETLAHATPASEILAMVRRLLGRAGSSAGSG